MTCCAIRKGCRELTLNKRIISYTSLCAGYFVFCLTIRTMEQERFKEILEIGETIRVEFKRCGNGIESDTYETVCSFLNRFGGDIF